MKTAFVTGGSGGIGSEICRMLARNGCAVAVGYCGNGKAAFDICGEIAANGGVALAVKIDLTNPNEIKTALDTVNSQLGSLDILVNCAGTARIGLFADLSDEEMLKLMAENLTGTMLLTKAAVPQMVHRHSGYIVNISSVWGEVGASCEVAYSAAKAGIIGFTKALSKELAPSGILVNCVSAGFIDTKMNSELSKADVAAAVEDIPLGRIGKPSDIVNAVEFLTSGRADYISGQVIRCDGGWV